MRPADVRSIPRRVQVKLVPAWPAPGSLGVGTGLGQEEDEGLPEPRPAKGEQSSLRKAVPLPSRGHGGCTKRASQGQPCCPAACP